eukprot:2779066-Amphidinium_carterae.1
MVEITELPFDGPDDNNGNCHGLETCLSWGRLLSLEVAEGKRCGIRCDCMDRHGTHDLQLSSLSHTNLLRYHKNQNCDVTVSMDT